MKIQRFCSVLLIVWLGLAGACTRAPAELLADAEEAVAAGDLATADIHLRNLLRDDPDNAAARALLGRVSADLGNFGAAEAHLRRAIELGVDPAGLRLFLLRSLVGQQKFAEAVTAFESGPELAGNDRIESLRLAALAHRSLDQIAESEALYREALSLSPGSEEIRTELASLVLGAGRIDEAFLLIEGVLATDRQYTPGLLVRGQIETQRGFIDAAEQTYRNVLELVDPGSIDFLRARLSLVEVLLARGKFVEADPYINELLAATPQDPIVRFFRAQIVRQNGDLNEAESLLDGILADSPSFAPANQLLGAIKADQGQFGQAEMHLRAAIAEEPDDLSIQLMLARTYLRQNKTDEARELLTALFRRAEPLDAPAEAVTGPAVSGAEIFTSANVYLADNDIARAAFVLDGGNFSELEGEMAALYELVLVHLDSGDLNSATDVADEIADAMAGESWPRVLQGILAMRGERYQNAATHFSAALGISPDDVRTWVSLGTAEIFNGNRAAARQALGRAVELDPDQGTSAGALVELAIEDRDFDDARMWLDRVPNSTGRLRLSAVLAVAEGRLEEGAALYDELFDAEPTALNARLAFAAGSMAGRPDPAAPLRTWLSVITSDTNIRFELGNYELGRGDLAAAQLQFETIVDQDPTHAVAMNNLAVVYDLQGDDRALATALGAYRTAPQDASIADTVGWIYVGQGDAATGLPYLEQAAAELPGIPEVQYHLAVALEETGDVDNALRIYREALSSGSDFAGRDDAERRLAELAGR